MSRVQPGCISSVKRILLAVPALMLMGAVAHADTAAKGPTFGQWGVETRYIAPEIAPGDDFYRHVNKGWLDTAQIPAGLPMNGAFVALAVSTEQQLQVLIDELQAQRPAPGTLAQQVADLQASYLDVARRNALGSRPLQAGLDEILALDDRRALSRHMGKLGQRPVVDVVVDRDAVDPSRYLLQIAQGGLGMPGRDYYLTNEEPYIGLRSAYRDYIEGVFQRAGVGDGKARAEAIVAFETALAATQWTPEAQRDPIRTYHPVSVKALARYAPGIDWQGLLAERGFDGVKRVNLMNDTAVKGAAELFSKTPVDTLRAYLAFHYLDNRAPLLSQAWVDASFDFHQRRLGGIAEPRPVDKQALDFLGTEPMAEQVGQLYAARYFPPEYKAAMEKLVGFLRAAFRERLAQAAWMDAPTRKAAIAKLDAITFKIGYPDKWHDMSSVKVARDDLLGNVMRYEAWARQDARAKLAGPARKWEWPEYITPQVINADYNPTGNAIAFPAGILQAPFFDPKADPAINYGAIGMVIGHEMGHGFDDQGNRFDGKGVMRNWWTEKARAGFEQRARQLVAQYDRYSPLPGLNVSGKLTLGENIGDLGGLTIAWTAYQKLVATEYAGKAPVIDGYTGEQRFFLGYAQLWRSQYNEGFLRRITLTDAHSPGEFRVNGVLRNFGPWYDTFNVKPGNALYLPPEARVSIW